MLIFLSPCRQHDSETDSYHWYLIWVLVGDGDPKAHHFLKLNNCKDLRNMAILVNGKAWDSNCVISVADIQKKQREAEVARQKAELSENRGKVYENTLKTFTQNMNNVNGSFIGSDPLRIKSVVRDEKDNIVVELSNRATPDEVTDADKFSISASTTTVLKSMATNSDGGTTLIYRLAGEPDEPTK